MSLAPPSGASSSTQAPHAAPARSPLLPLFGLLLFAYLGVLYFVPGIEGTRLAIRLTARTSLCFFLLAYLASALAQLWPAHGGVAWLRAHRRQWGRLLVASHGLHAVAIIMLAVAAPALFSELAPIGNRITGGLAYVILLAMGLTSWNQPAAWLGPKWWARLHTWGSHYLWLSFLVANGKRIPASGYYWLPTLALLVALAVRLWASRLSSVPAVPQLKAAPASAAPAAPTALHPAAAGRR